MFDVLADYNKNDHFFFTGDRPGGGFNTPKSGMGVYLVYELKNGRITLIYVGAAGKVKQTGRRKAKEGFYEELVNGDHFNGKRAETWK